MELEKNYDGKELTIIVKDSVDTVTAPDFENAIIDEFDKFDSLIVDFKELEYISSAGLRVLVTVQKKLKPQNIPFVYLLGRALGHSPSNSLAFYYFT